MKVSPLHTAPTIPDNDQLWLLDELFRPEWSRAITVDNEYKTNIESGISQAEQRYGLRSKPLRSMTVRFLAGGRENARGTTEFAGGVSNLDNLRESSALIALARRYAQAKTTWPLFTDEATLTSDALSGTDTFFCDTSYKRFQVGRRVLIIQGEGGDGSFNIDGPYYSELHAKHVAVVSDVQSDRVVIDTADPNITYVAGSRIIPLIEAQITFQSSGTVINDGLIDMRVTVTEEEGDTQYDPITRIGGLPVGLEDFSEGLPVFEPDYDYSKRISWNMTRAGGRTSSGAGGVSEALGSRGKVGFNFTIQYFNREDAFRDASMFESRGGRLLPFWFVPPVRENYRLNGVLFGGTQVVLSNGGTSTDLLNKPYLFFRPESGVTQIRKITSAFDFGVGTFLVILDKAMTIAEEDVVEFGTCYKARFDSDSMTESWDTTALSKISFDVTEIEQEKITTITDLTYLDTDTLLNRYLQGACSVPVDLNATLSPCDGCGPTISIPGADEAVFFEGATVQIPKTEWEASTEYEKGDLIRPTGDDAFIIALFANRPDTPHPLRVAFRCIQAGTTSSSEPEWRVGCEHSAITDGTVLWKRTYDCYTVSRAPIEAEYPDPPATVKLDCSDCISPPECPCERDLIGVPPADIQCSSNYSLCRSFPGGGGDCGRNLDNLLSQAEAEVGMADYCDSFIITSEDEFSCGNGVFCRDVEFCFCGEVPSFG